MNQSATIGKIAEALAKAQGTLEGAKKDSKNPFFKSSYADLESVWNACRKALADNGLAVIQTTEGPADSIALVTTLVHSSGEWMRGSLPLCPPKTDPQGIGSAITYARRYALAAIVGVCQTDDDGEAAMTSHREKHIATQGNHDEAISNDQAKLLEGFLSADEEGRKLMQSRLKVGEVKNMKKSDFEKVANWLRQRKQEKENGKGKLVTVA